MILAPLAFWAAAGCTFHHTLVNENVLRLDTSDLRVGETTWLEALEQLGPPVSANTPQQLLRARIDERTLRYVAAEGKSVGLMVPLVITTLPFRWSDVQNTYTLLLEFDENKKLKAAHQTRRESIWWPLAKQAERKPPVTRTIVGRDSS
jgi:hypothetical protein